MRLVFEFDPKRIYVEMSKEDYSKWEHVDSFGWLALMQVLLKYPDKIVWRHNREDISR
jgi:hypothetical protein